MPEEAAECCRKSAKLNPKCAETYNSLGLALLDLYKTEEALENFNKALNINPDNPETYYNIALAYSDINRFDLAMDYYKKSREADKNYFDAIYGMGICLLKQKNFETGFKAYECRFMKKEPAVCPQLPNPLPFGADIGDKTVYVVSEQGYGDNIQFARYLPILAQKAKKVLYKPYPPLQSLFAGNIPGVEIVGSDMPDREVSYDYYMPVMSLPYILKAKYDNIPYAEGYLKPDFNKVSAFKRKYFENSSTKVGLFWKTNVIRIKGKSIPLNLIEETLLKVPDALFYSLQKEVCEIIPERENIIDLSEAINDFSDTAALIENLDLVITIDTAVAHLAGAMGKEVRVMLPYSSEWRWFDTDYSPWYKNMKLFRQAEAGNWTDVIVNVTKELELKFKK